VAKSGFITSGKSVANAWQHIYTVPDDVAVASYEFTVTCNSVADADYSVAITQNTGPETIGIPERIEPRRTIKSGSVVKIGIPAFSAGERIFLWATNAEIGMQIRGFETPKTT